MTRLMSTMDGVASSDGAADEEVGAGAVAVAVAVIGPAVIDSVRWERGAR
jgi:hypothetical protein